MFTPLVMAAALLSTAPPVNSPPDGCIQINNEGRYALLSNVCSFGITGLYWLKRDPTPYMFLTIPPNDSLPVPKRNSGIERTLWCETGDWNSGRCNLDTLR